MRLLGSESINCNAAWDISGVYEIQKETAHRSATNPTDPSVHKVRDLGFRTRYMARMVSRPYAIANMMEGAKSESNGTPPMGAGKVNGAA